MASKTISIGSRGNMQIIITQVSQNEDNNTSRVQVRGYVWLDSGSSADSTGNCKAKISGNNTEGPNTVNGSYSTDHRKVIDETWTVGHDSQGYKKVTYTFSFGPTITSNLGDGGSVTLSMNLTRIGKKPDAPAAPTGSLTSPGTVTLNWNVPDDNGKAITEYQVRYANNSAFTGALSVSSGTTRSKAVSGLGNSQTWYFQVRAKNAIDWGSWSPTFQYTIGDPPGRVPIPTVTTLPPSSIIVDLTPPDPGGSPITEYEIELATSSSFQNPTSKSGPETQFTFTSLSVGATYYIRARAKNLQGIGEWSNIVVTQASSGPKVLYNGEWRSTVCYVRVNGVWVLAVPYVNQDGVWKVVNG